MPSTGSATASAQARLQLRRGTVARLMEWQSQAVGQGLGKPTYSQLIDGLVTRARGVAVADLLADIEAAS